MEPITTKMPSWMEAEIEDRREKSENRSEYIRDAIRARFQQEDDGDWDFDFGDIDTEEQQPAD